MTNFLGKLLPELEVKLTGGSIGVSVLNVSMAVLHSNLERDATREEANESLRDISLNGAVQPQVDYTVPSELVSADLTGNPLGGIEDSYAMNVNKRDVVIYDGYDDEFGYTCQVIRIAQKMAGVLCSTAPVQPLIHYS